MRFSRECKIVTTNLFRRVFAWVTCLRDISRKRHSINMLGYDRIDISEGIDIKKNKRIKRVQNLPLLVL